MIYAEQILANTKALQGIIDDCPFGETILLPNGKYYFDQAIEIKDKCLTLQGGADTTLVFGDNSNLKITRSYDSGIVTLNDFTVKGDGSVLGGIEIHSQSILNRITSRNFGGNGFSFWGDVSQGTNSSASKLYDCNAIENLNGFYSHGGDANQICFFGCDARDNKEWGFDDESFLGDQFFGCMAHANKAGHYKAGGSNNRASFLGCYAEGDSPENWLAGIATWVGGLAANGFKIYERASVQSGNHITSLKFGERFIEISPDAITLLQENVGSFPIRFTQQKNKLLPHFAYSDNWGNVQEIFSGTDEWKANYKERQIPFSASGFSGIFIGSTLLMQATPDDPRFSIFEFKFGDTLLNPGYDGKNIRAWIYKKNGWEEQK